MKKRIILNVATGRYTAYQDRLMNSLYGVVNVGSEIVNIRPGCFTVLNQWSFMSWRDAYPPGSPTHGEDPYAFKLFAIDEAIRLGYETILWCDSGVWFMKDPAPIFERTERDGCFIIIGGDKLFHWTSDFALDLFGETRDAVEKKDWQLIGGTVYGFDLTNPTIQKFLAEWKRYYQMGAFRGPYVNNCAELPEDVKRVKGEKPHGFVSNDPRCWGHRHDETIGSFLVYNLGMKLTNLGDLFQGGQRDDKPDAVARSGY